MRYTLYILLLICLKGNSLLAQDQYAIIKGTAPNTLLNRIAVEVDTRYHNQELKSYEAEIVDDYFEIQVPLLQGQIVALKFMRNRAEFFLEPNDILTLELDVNSFPFGIEMSGSAKDNNLFLKDFREQFKIETSFFKMKQYRKGMFWYKSDENTERLMRQYNPADYFTMLDRERAAKKNMLVNRKSTLSDALVQFIEEEIKYEKAYKALMYGHVFGYIHKIDMTSFINNLQDVPLINEPAISNVKYRDYVYAKINFLAMQDKATNSYVKQYQLTEELLEGEMKSYMQSDLLLKAFSAGEFLEVIDIYQQFVSQESNERFFEKVTDAFQLANKYTVGSLAPDFQLKDTSGQMVNLSQYQGKVIFMNFWASWCQPCIKKMDALNDLKAELNDENIVFLYISFDENAENWKRMIDAKSINGIHVQASEGVNSLVAQEYNVKALPEYFIIDKQGQFLKKTKGFDLLGIKSILIEAN